jgi:hypothetical protein
MRGRRIAYGPASHGITACDLAALVIIGTNAIAVTHGAGMGFGTLCYRRKLAAYSFAIQSSAVIRPRT